MIPKIIHYVWLGNNHLGELGEKCIASWKKFCPDYKIIRWDENNSDISQSNYAQQALAAKKFAFASDYIRLQALVNHGGIYMDTDVELLASLDNFLSKKAFVGFERDDAIQTALMACEKGHPLFEEFLAKYESRNFVVEYGKYDMATNVERLTSLCIEKGLRLDNTLQEIAGVIVYPTEYFCPKCYHTGQLNLTANSISIHHFDASWWTDEQRKIHFLISKYKRKYGKRWKFMFSLFHPIKALQIKQQSNSQKTLEKAQK
ncbi:MAG: glycosyl transferase [Firmicutes bacterium]|nr:glycosyl transferase [Bacillota bacterium]